MVGSEEGVASFVGVGDLEAGDGAIEGDGFTVRDWVDVGENVKDDEDVYDGKKREMHCGSTLA